MADSPSEAADSPETEGDLHRRQAIAANNSVWDIYDGRSYGPDDVDELLGRAYAAAHHWRRATGTGPVNAARASWLLSRCHAVLGHGELALHHAEQSARVVEGAGLHDFDLAYAHEARARAFACLGRMDDAAAELALARAVVVADPEDRSIVESDIVAEPWFGLAL
jgi:hypothetical protein